MADARTKKPAAAGFSDCFEKAITLGETEKGSEHLGREAGHDRGGEHPMRKPLDYGGKWSGFRAPASGWERVRRESHSSG